MKRVIVPMTAVAAFVLASSSFAADDSDALALQVKQLSAQTKKLQKEVANLKSQNQQTKKVAEKAHADVKQPWPRFVTVTTTPFIGSPLAFDGSDLLYNFSSINEDLSLLQRRQQVVNELKADGYDLDRPVLQVSGAVAGSAYSNGGFGLSPSNGVNLSTAEFDFNAIASSWASAFMSLDYNGAPVSSGNRAPNSTIYLSRGFLTIGNLNVTPFYFSAGEMYAPFGRYASNMVSTPLTQSLARIRTPAALAGFSLTDGLYGSVYGYAGSRTSGSSEVFKQGGTDLGFRQKFATNDSYSLAAGWVSNIADSQGMQNTGLGSATQFSGFGQSTNTSSDNNLLAHNVDAADVHGHLTVGPLTFLGEYITSLESFAATDMTFDGSGAKPAVMHTEMDYMLPFFAKKHSTSIGVSYGRTWQALALNLPEQSYATFFNTSIWRDTQESIEYRHDGNYASGSSANGQGGTTPITPAGSTRNSVVGQVSVFF